MSVSDPGRTTSLLLPYCKGRGRCAVETVREDDALLTVGRAVIGVATRAADAPGGVSVVQLRALTVLRDLGTASLVQLAEGMGVTASTTSRLVDRLVSAGHAERRPSPERRR